MADHEEGERIRSGEPCLRARREHSQQSIVWLTGLKHVKQGLKHRLIWVLRVLATSSHVGPLAASSAQDYMAFIFHLCEAQLEDHPDRSMCVNRFCCRSGCDRVEADRVPDVIYSIIIYIYIYTV